MPDLTVTIREAITLPNGNPQVSENTTTIKGTTKERIEQVKNTIAQYV